MARKGPHGDSIREVIPKKKRTMKQIIFISLGVLTILLNSCKSDPKPPPMVKKDPVSIPAFNGENAYLHVVKQLSFGFRVPGTAAHKEQIEWMAATMENLGATVHRQNFEADFLDKKDIECTNVMAQFNPEHPRRVLLAAHFDSRMVADKDSERKDEPIPGADDGASGVAVLMEIASVISEQQIDLGVDFLFLDAEDQGNNKDRGSWALGSQLWSQQKEPTGYNAKYGILLDMVGSEKATFGKEGYSVKYAPQLTKKVWTLADRMGYSDLFQNFSAGGIEDDHYYINTIAKIPMIDIINLKPDDRQSFGDYHHTHDDDISIISKRSLRVVGQVVTAVLYKESEGSF
ncbi:MAG: glutaminyl-peptide cyclotransferase [Saprospiraceae bacterium]|jgi:glutaminyl-peptide cyclotransferase